MCHFIPVIHMRAIQCHCTTAIQYSFRIFLKRKKIKRLKLKIYKYLNSIEVGIYTEPVSKVPGNSYGRDFSNDGHALRNGCNLKSTEKKIEFDILNSMSTESLREGIIKL